MSNVKNIIDALKNQGANPDLSQINLIEKLCKMNISKKFSFKKVFSKDNLLGTYIWGDVGRGKTLITKTYLKELKRDDIKSFHYIDLMSYIHDQLNKNSGVKNPLSKISKALTKDTSIIFIDEFQVEDVADAMIIGDFLKHISGHGTKIILTSNAHPNDLYLDGLQRQKFLASLKIFLENVNIHKLDGEIDYRTRNIIKFDEHESNKIIPDEEIFKFIIDNFGLDQQKSDQILINDRKFNCKLVSNNILWIEFNDFFAEATGSKDYTYISNKFDWIFISNFKKNNDDTIDIVRRFISFIDITYTNRTKIKFFFNDIAIESIYLGSKIENLWVRCKSRLSEMRTQEYLTNN